MPNHIFTATNALNISFKQVKPPRRRLEISHAVNKRSGKTGSQVLPQHVKTAKTFENGARRKNRNSSPPVTKRKRLRHIAASRKKPTTATQDSTLWLLEGNTQTQTLDYDTNSGEVTTSSPDPLPPSLVLPTFYAVNKETIWEMGDDIIKDSEDSWNEGETIVDVVKGQERGVNTLEDMDRKQTIDRVERRQYESWVSAPAFKSFPVNNRQPSLVRGGTLLAPGTGVIRTRSWGTADRQNVLPAKGDVAEDINDASSPEICSALEKEEKGRVISACVTEALPTSARRIVLDTNSLSTTIPMRSCKNHSQSLPTPPTNHPNIPPAVSTASETDNPLNDNLVPCPSSQPPSFNLRYQSRLLTTVTRPPALDADGSLSANGAVRNPLLRRMLRTWERKSRSLSVNEIVG